MSFRGWILLLAAAAGVSVLGAQGGKWWVRWQEQREQQELERREARIGAGEASRLRAGEPFPSIALFDLAGNRVVTDTLAGPEGALVLCLVSDCEPCRDYIKLWCSRVNEAPEGVRVYALSYENREVLGYYARDVGMGFPALCDTARVIRDTYELELYPTVVGIAAGGRIAFVRHGLDEWFLPKDAAALLAGSEPAVKQVSARGEPSRPVGATKSYF